MKTYSFRKRVFFQLVLCAFCIAWPEIFTGQPAAAGSFSFKLPAKARTSAGVYKKDGTLVRTLWSLVDCNEGEHVEKWDGLLDDGTPAPKGNYEVKVLSSNVQYEWEGAVIGNTSIARTGNTKLRFFDPLYGMAVSNGNIYWAAGYNEGWPADYRTTINDPNSKTWIGPLRQTNQMSTFVCADGNFVYWAGHDPLDANNESFVFATRISDDKRVVFPAGTPAKMEWGSTYESAIAYMNTPKNVPSLITGTAVESKGNYLFISRKGLNELEVLNKNTGGIVRKISIPSPSVMGVDHRDRIWLAHDTVVEKYEVSGEGAFISSGLTIPVSKAGAISVSPDDAVVIIADINTEQVRAFSNSTGLLLWSLGSSVSYVGNSTVDNYKFYWKDVRKEYPTFLSYLPDGSFYVGDLQNRRIIHYSRDRAYINMIMYQQALYDVSVDPNDPTRLFADFLEFKIDYSKPLDRANGSWTLVRNWGANIDKGYDFSEKMRFLVTLKNGHTYARLRKGNQYTVIELVHDGTVRYTNISFPQFGLIDEEGSKIVGSPPVSASSQILNKYPLTGFDSANNPIWSDIPEELMETPPLSSNDPVSWEGWRSVPFTSTHQVIFFDYGKPVNGHSEGYHLGAIQLGKNNWLWKTAQSTSVNYTGPFPRDGWFDIGNKVKYPGGLALVSGQNIFWNYRGENWKQNQTNIWNHVYDNGLMVGQFGSLAIDHIGEEAFAEDAGNVLTGSLVTYQGETYLYHNDEAFHSAVHRWRIRGLGTISVQTAEYPISDHFTNSGAINLLEGLKRGAVLTDGTGGWTRDPAIDYNHSRGDFFSAIIGNKTYDNFKDPDLFIYCAIKWRNPSASASVTRDLGTPQKVNSWKLQGQVLFDLNAPNEPSHPSRGGSFMDIIDHQGKVIARFFIQRNPVSGIDVIGNNQVICHLTVGEWQQVYSKFRQIEISGANGYITIQFAEYKAVHTSILIDQGADWRAPEKIRLYFYTNDNADDYDRSIDFSELRFWQK